MVAAASEASQVLVGTTALLESVYLDIKPTETASIGKTINVPIPDAAVVADSGVGDPVFTDSVVATKAIQMSGHPQAGRIVRDFEQYNTPRSMRDLFIDPAIKGIGESINSAIGALLTTGNFTVNSAVSCTGGLVSTTQFLSGRAELQTSKVPLSDYGNLTFVNSGFVDAKILGDSSWVEQAKAGDATSARVRELGALRSAYGFRVVDDQAMDQLTTGTASTRTFRSAAFHRYAIALVSRPLPAVDPNVVDSMTVFWKSIPIRVSVGYSIAKAGYLISVEAGYGLAVIRPEMGLIFTVTEA